jgi:hypothetical protein
MPDYAGGKNDDYIQTILYDRLCRFGYWYSLDYSSFDQSISSWLIRDAFEIIRDAFKSPDDELFDVIVHDFIHKDFVTKDGWIHSDKGVPSGSMFTQIIDSLVNMICISCYLFSRGVGESEFAMMVMGDDNLLFLRNPIDVEDMSSYLRKNLGIIMNPSKLKSGLCKAQYPAFLSRVWRPGGRWRHPNVLISKVAYPERFRPYDKREVTPAQVLYGYCLAYKAGMEEMMDVHRFLADHPNHHEWIASQATSRYVPGYLRFNREYLMS